MPALLDETRASLPALKAVAEAKAGPEGVRAVIGKRLSLYPQPQRTAEEWDAWWSDYFDVLEDVTLASLEAGMRAHVADPQSEFMPKPGRLRELAFLAPCRSLNRYYRAKRAIQMADEPPVEIAPADPADAGLIRQMAAEAAQQLSQAPKLRRVEMPSTAGIPDAGGLTPQMRALMARRAEAGR